MIEYAIFIWTRFIDLTWWQMILWICYLFYFGVRARDFWIETREGGLIKGYRHVMFGCDKYFRVYHIFRIVFDIPPAIIGLFFPILRKVFSYKIYTFKNDPKNNFNSNSDL